MYRGNMRSLLVSSQLSVISSQFSALSCRNWDENSHNKAQRGKSESGAGTACGSAGLLPRIVTLRILQAARMSANWIWVAVSRDELPAGGLCE